jgi:hypothetical protein
MVFQSDLSVAKNSRSPGSSALIGTSWVARYCGRAVRGSEMPAAAKALCTSPEQSNSYGPSAPHKYGLPRWSSP